MPLGISLEMCPAPRVSISFAPLMVFDQNASVLYLLASPTTVDSPSQVAPMHFMGIRQAVHATDISADLCQT